MFYGCTSLEKLNMHNFDVDKKKPINYMFYNCIALKEINISSFRKDFFDFNIVWFGCSDEFKNQLKQKMK